MKRTSSLIFGLVFAVLIAVPQIALGQAPEMPDYSMWQVSDTGSLEATLNGQTVKLSYTEYHFRDNSSQVHMDVNVLNNENETSWLAYFLVESLSSNGLSVVQFYLFEFQNSEWVLVKDLTTNETELPEILKNRYNLEFK